MFTFRAMGSISFLVIAFMMTLLIVKKKIIKKAFLIAVLIKFECHYVLCVRCSSVSKARNISRK